MRTKCEAEFPLLFFFLFVKTKGSCQLSMPKNVVRAIKLSRRCDSFRIYRCARKNREKGGVEKQRSFLSLNWSPSGQHCDIIRNRFDTRVRRLSNNTDSYRIHNFIFRLMNFHHFAVIKAATVIKPGGTRVSNVNEFPPRVNLNQRRYVRRRAKRIFVGTLSIHNRPIRWK